MRKILLAAAVLVAASASARANLTDWSWLTQYKAPNLHYGQLALHPYYRFEETYDSNIYVVPKDLPSGQIGGGVRSSWITKNILGMEADLPWHHINDLLLGYDFEADKYSHQPAINDTINQALHADLVRRGGQGMTYKLGDQYVNTTDQAFSELIQRERRWMNRVYGEIDYTPTNGRLAGGVDASHETDKYLDPALAAALNRYEQSIGFNVGYMVQPKTKAYVSYHRGIIHYSVHNAPGVPEKNNKSHSAGVGLKGQFTPKLDGQVEVGGIYRQYDAAPVSGASRVDRSVSVATELTYRPDKYSKVSLALSRYLQESADPNNPFYVSNNATLSMDHKFPYKFTAGIDLAMGIDQYRNAQTVTSTPGSVVTGNRRDDLYQGGAWVEYDIQAWLSTGLAYVYRERNSTLTGQFNYQDTQVTWNAALKF